MKYTNLLFDLDDTVYPHTAGLWDEIRHRMDQYMRECLNLADEEIPRLRKSFLETYGTTLRGLQYAMHIDAQEFLAYVHDIPIENYLRANNNLRQILMSLPQNCWIFTNSDINHAQRVLKALNLIDCFEGIIDVNALEFIPKPDPLAFQKALTLIGGTAESSVFFDDAIRNLIPAQILGFTIVLVGRESFGQNDGIKYQVSKLEDISLTLPWLWNSTA